MLRFHGDNTGSNPVGDANIESRAYIRFRLPFEGAKETPFGAPFAPSSANILYDLSTSRRVRWHFNVSPRNLRREDQR
jgi:hypothetical protein